MTVDVGEQGYVHYITKTLEHPEGFPGREAAEAFASELQLNAGIRTIDPMAPPEPF